MASQRVRALVDLSRTRQALLSVAQPALGAVLALGALPPGRVVAMGGAAAACGYLAVFSLNDVLDRHVDQRALAEGKAEFEGHDIDTAFVRHPLARGDLTLAFSWAWVAGLAIVAVVLGWLLNPLCVALFAASVALEGVYCALRSVSPLKTIVSGVMVAIGGLAGWVAVAPISLKALSFFAFLVAWEIAGRNLPNDLADIAPDARVGIRTVATVWGPRVSAEAIMAGTLATAAAVVVMPETPLGKILGVIAVLWAMGLPALGLIRRPTSEQAGAFFNRASLLPVLLFGAAIASVIGA